MDYKEALDYLTFLEKERRIKLGLDNVRALLASLGNPQTKFKSVHVGGTNGKGSVCAMLDAVLQQSGYKVGRYTSPHLVQVNERFTINGMTISNDDFAHHLSMVKAEVTTQTYFEVTTALAFLYFADKGVDIACIEVGLGGRLDATNVVTPQVSVITTIALEHTEWLGNSVEAIAGEKAGIIKPHVPVVTATSGRALKVITQKAQEQQAPLQVVSSRRARGYKTSLIGRFQRQNLAVVLEVIDCLRGQGFTLPETDVRKGLLQTTWPGRFQFLQENLLVDCAHNPAGIAVLVSALRELQRKKSFANVFLIFGVLKDKDYSSMIKPLLPLVTTMILVRPNTERALDPEELKAHIQSLGLGPTPMLLVIPYLKEAMAYVQQQTTSKDLVIITGSIYLVGEIFSLFDTKHHVFC
ncbi:bifunctional folylpolyglutamate synthase/dihydrofolate synthase [Candidatus Woesearchaeota archaeon]|nr:bifunctional folylpolyglutamate synthase/dihydrofolate synthase [Candidatus Woesearchaeota archaeon]